ncbi:MAG: hypothetical protein Q8K75_10050 [Chlamydiales bacterium]|nr:hypothetical protein [Chlamydiales bacterium]
MANINFDIKTSPMTTWAMDSTEKLSNDGKWVKASLAIAASSVPTLVEGALVHLPLSFAKAAVATTMKTIELGAAAFGKNINLNDHCLSNYTGSQAINHLGKTVGSVIGSAVCLIGFVYPSAAIAFNRALGLAKTPATPPTKMQKVMNAVVENGKKAVRVAKKGADMGVQQARKHPRIALAAGLAVAGLALGGAEYQFGYGRQVGGMALDQGIILANKADDLSGNYVSGAYNATVSKGADVINYAKSYFVTPEVPCVDDRASYNFWSANPCAAK